MRGRGGNKTGKGKKWEHKWVKGWEGVSGALVNRK